MIIVLHSSVIGTDNLHMVYDVEKAEYNFSTDIPDDAWIIHNKIKFTNDLFSALKLSGIMINTNPPEAYMKYGALVPESMKEQIKWQKVMPKKLWESWVLGIIDNIKNNIKNINFDYYNNVYRKTDFVLNALQPIKIDRARWEAIQLKEKNPSILSHIRSFRPNKDDFASNIVYDQDTISGRMRVKSGPEILVLRKDLRNVIKSRYGDEGSIYMVDCVSLEPRTALLIAKKELPDDIYLDISTKLFGGKIDRSVIKLFVLSAMYGAGADVVSVESGISAEECRLYYLPKIKEYFKINQISKELYKECNNNNGQIKNIFGRVIFVEDRRPHKIYNHEVQSSAVDIGMILFYNLLENIKGLDIVPVGLIHDCLILDGRKSLKDKLEEAIEKSQTIDIIQNKIRLEYSTL